MLLTDYIRFVFSQALASVGFAKLNVLEAPSYPKLNLKEDIG